MVHNERVPQSGIHNHTRVISRRKDPAVSASELRVECVTHVTRFRRVEQEKPVS